MRGLWLLVGMGLLVDGDLREEGEEFGGEELGSESGEFVVGECTLLF